MIKYFYAIILLVGIGCKEKKLDFSGELPLDQKDFFGVFKPINLPYSVSDTNIDKTADKLEIGLKAFIQFFPDSAFQPIMGNNRKFILHPIGKIEKQAEHYYLMMLSYQKKKKLIVFVTDKKQKYLASKELLSSDKHDDYSHMLSINKEPTFLISKEKNGKDNLILFSRAGWAYNEGSFMVVINDSNEDPEKTAVVNPIDTVSQSNKFSGDYVKDKNNYISIRDGKHINNYLFFIHFEKNSGTCTGELKGELKMKTTVNGIYSENGDPCIIDFTFEGNQLFLKEQGSCGNHRGIKCYFNDEYKKIKRTSKKGIKTNK